MQIPAGLPVVVALALISSPSAAQDVVTHRSKTVAITLPAGWKVQSKHTKMKDLGETLGTHRILSFFAMGPGMDRGVKIDVDVSNSGAYRIRPTRLRDRILYNSYQGVNRVDLVDAPMLHLIAHIAKPSDGVLAMTYTRAIGRTVKLMVRCASSQWDTVRPAILEMAMTLELNLPPWPSPARGRRENISNGIVFSATKQVKKSALRELQKCALDVQRGMVEMHGQIGRPRGEPLRIYVNELMADHKLIAESQTVEPVVTEPKYHRLFTIPLAARGSKQRSDFVSGLAQVLLVDLYGFHNALWFDYGEQMVAVGRDATKRKLPTVQRITVAGLTISMKFDELIKYKKAPAQDFQGQCLAYVGMFHAGPKEYRAAYQAFLKDLQATGDTGEATKKHLLVLDQIKLQHDVRSFVKKLRPIHVKVR